MEIDVDQNKIIITVDGTTETIDFKVGAFDQNLVKQDGWVGYAEMNY